MSDTQNNNNLKGVALVYNGSVAYASRFAAAAKISGVSIGKIASLGSPIAGIFGVLANAAVNKLDNTQSNAEVVGRTAVDLACFAIGCIPVVGVVGGSLAMFVANFALTKEQAEAIGDAIITVYDKAMENVQVYELQDLVDSGELTAEDIVAIQDLVTMAENITTAQAELQEAMQTYLPYTLDTTDVYATSEHLASPIVFDLNGDGISTTNVKENYINFDLDGNGFAERTGWIEALSVNKCAA